jgi:hypothetical protein
MCRILTCLFIGLFVLVLVSGPAWAQVTAQISGTVRDQSGAVLPGVEITTTHTGTGIARGVITNETGSFVLPNLPIGPHRIEASLPASESMCEPELSWKSTVVRT